MLNNSTKSKKTFIVIHDGKIIKVSQGFSNLTDYSIDELVGKSYTEISQMLKFNLHSIFECTNDNFNIYLFTKLLEPREITVSLKLDESKHNTIYFFDENENSRLERKFLYVEQLFAENNNGIAIYSACDLVLLKANQKFIDYLNKPFNKKENCIGKHLDQIVKDFKGSVTEEIWTNIIDTGKTFYASEVMCDRYGSITYWDLSIVPIYEDGKIKYLVENCIEVTERVLSRKLIEEQAAKIERQDKKIEAMIELADEHISIFGKNGEFIKLSKVLIELFELNKVNNIHELKDKIKVFDIDRNEISFENSEFCSISIGKEINNYKGIIKTGSIEKYVIMNGKPIFDRCGKFERYILIINDITEIMQSKIIEHRKNELEAIIENMSDGLFTIDMESKFSLLNNGAKEFLYNSDSIKKLGDTFEDVKYYDSKDNLIRLENMPSYRVLNGEKIKEYRISAERPDGMYHFNISGSPIYDKHGNIIKALICTRNITEEVNSEKLIRLQKWQLEAVIDNISDGIIMVDKDGKIIEMNPEARNLLYQSKSVKFADEFISNIKFFDIDNNEIDINNLPLRHALKGEKVKNKIILMKQLDKELVLRVNSTPVYGTNGDLIMALVCFHDITDLMDKEKIIIEKYKQLEMLKKEAEDASKIKSLFLANMSHEIRTPMNGIVGTIQLLQSTTLSMEQSKYITMLKESSNTLLAIINDILDISKIEYGTYKLNNEQFSLKKIVDSIYNNLLICGNSKGLEVSYYFDPAANCSVIGDEFRLKQILNNLINNAVKFTEEGYISFRVTKLSCDNDGLKIKFTIKDTGIGIDESFKEKIFSAFNQGDTSISKKYMGTGLGLAISKHLATLMNGNISFESVIGQGSTFSFTCKLKRIDNKSNNIKMNDIRDKNKTYDCTKNKVILCVEDNLIEREVMESIVKRKGYNYIAASNGNEALKILKDNRVDLILLDVKMPELNGFETTKVIREKEKSRKHIPIIAMTAHAMIGDRDKCIEAGMDDYISKPFNIEELYNIFEFYLGK
jgi:signal transduction histidine kinase